MPETAPESTATMIRDVEAMLRGMLIGELQQASPDYARRPVQVAFGTPARQSALDGDRINLYLTDISENLARKESGPTTVRKTDDQALAGRALPPVYLDVSYLLTFESSVGISAEGQLLFDTLCLLLRTQTVPEVYLPERFAGASDNAVYLTMANTRPSLADQSRLWQTFQEPLRPSLLLSVTVKFYPFETKWVRVVREVLLGIAKGTLPEGFNETYHQRVMRVSIAGIVIARGSGQPVSQAGVRVIGTDFVTTTDARGMFFLINMAPGRQTLEVSARGYQVHTRGGMVNPPGQPEQLEPLVIELTPLERMGTAPRPQEDNGGNVVEDSL